MPSCIVSPPLPPSIRLFPCPQREQILLPPKSGNHSRAGDTKGPAQMGEAYGVVEAIATPQRDGECAREGISCSGRVVRLDLDPRDLSSSGVIQDVGSRLA